MVCFPSAASFRLHIRHRFCTRIADYYSSLRSRSPSLFSKTSRLFACTSVACGATPWYLCLPPKPYSVFVSTSDSSSKQENHQQQYRNPDPSTPPFFPDKTNNVLLPIWQQSNSSVISNTKQYPQISNCQKSGHHQVNHLFKSTEDPWNEFERQIRGFLQQNGFLQPTTPHPQTEWTPASLLIALNVAVYIGWKLFPVPGLLFRHFVASRENLAAGRVHSLALSGECVTTIT